MRTLAFLLAAAVALPSFAATWGTVVIRDGDRQYAHGDSRDVGRTTDLGTRYAFFERDGVAYVIRDAATLARTYEIIKPQEALGRQQAKLGAEQAALGAKQAALGAKQAALGIRQAAAPGDAQLAAQQHALAEQQKLLADQQQPLARQQHALGEKQHAASKVALRELQKLFEDAIRRGVATRR